MLKLKNICKVYCGAEYNVTALDNINLNFRKSEFVCILGTSGSGKTTLLNVIGGLDQYTSGNLIINNKSTNEYSDYDWDLYRNHSVGFVFQSYNLIPHQNALANVELALTLSGVDKVKRKKLAVDALKKVGLEDQLYKKPSQMSGGQTQRVAIARALVNNPDILMADEPTGALDSTTSIQIMEILKTISKDKLVIMVTHNPELAQKYATRIIKLSDGKITDDSNPYEGNKVMEKTSLKKKTKKNFMSFKTALGLSLNNLATKKGRTILTSFAGAIGIIGIALVLSISNGVNKYINSVEEDTLSSYPITIEAQKIDATSLLESLNDNKKVHDISKKTIVTDDVMGNMLSVMTSEIKTNDLKAFKSYLESNNCLINEYSNVIQYGYNLNLQIYKDSSDEVVKLNPNNIWSSFGYEMNEMYSSMMPTAFVELFDNKELVETQYNVIEGRMPEKYDEVVLIVDENNMISDYTAYSLGLKDKSELDKAMQNIIQGKENDFKQDSYTFDELLDLKFKVLINTDYYKKVDGLWINMEHDKEYMLDKLDKALEMKVVGIIKYDESSVLNDSTSYGNIAYMPQLTEYIIKQVNNSQIAKEQKNNPNINVFTGKDFSVSSNGVYSSYENNLLTLGIVDIDSPSIINIYPKDFESKDEIKNIIDNYNKDKEETGKENEVISYTDYVGLLMNSVTTIIDVISYVLIAFVSVSLIVSSIMIGIITYISVLERTKEIGILRAIGASKKDISRVFNAETFIVGSLAGVLGIAVTIILNIPINLIIKRLSGISSIASLPVAGAIILILISILLTIIAGLIPSSMASKKDPVEALRSE